MLIILHSNNFSPAKIPAKNGSLIVNHAVHKYCQFINHPPPKYINFKLENITYVREIRILEAILHV